MRFDVSMIIGGMIIEIIEIKKRINDKYTSTTEIPLGTFFPVRYVTHGRSALIRINAIRSEKRMSRTNQKKYKASGIMVKSAIERGVIFIVILFCFMV